MNQSQIIELQRRIGTSPDGFWGPKSIAACQRHLKALMPKGGVWPSPADGAMVRFFGRQIPSDGCSHRNSNFPLNIQIQWID
jgi:hypothetical protein